MLDPHRRIHAQRHTAVWSNRDVDTVAPVTITRRPVERGRIPCGAVRASDGVDHPRLTSARIHDQLATSTCTMYQRRSHGWPGTPPKRIRPAQQRHSTATTLVQSPATEESTGTSTAKPTEQYEGAIHQDTLLPTAHPTSRHVQPPVNGTPSNERASCSTYTNAAARNATSVEVLNPRQSVHSPLTSQVKRQLSDPPTPSLQTDGT